MGPRIATTMASLTNAKIWQIAMPTACRTFASQSMTATATPFQMNVKLMAMIVTPMVFPTIVSPIVM